MSPTITFALVAALLTGIATAQTVNFDSFATGAPPPGWTATKTGSGNPKWTVERDDSAPSKPNVPKQSGQATYPVCIKDDTSLQDGFVEVKSSRFQVKRIRPAVSSGGRSTRTTTRSLVPMRSRTMSPFITRSMAGAQKRSGPK